MKQQIILEAGCPYLKFVTQVCKVQYGANLCICFNIGLLSVPEFMILLQVVDEIHNLSNFYGNIKLTNIIWLI